MTFDYGCSASFNSMIGCFDFKDGHCTAVFSYTVSKALELYKQLRRRYAHFVLIRHATMIQGPYSRNTNEFVTQVFYKYGG